MPAELAARFEILPSRVATRDALVGKCVLVNEGDQPAIVDLAPLSSPSLCVQVEDEQGSPVLFPPPPVPGGSDETATLEPGQQISVEHRGFMPAWIPEGRYRARLRYVVSSQLRGRWSGEIHSVWAAFEIRER